MQNETSLRIDPESHLGIPLRDLAYQTLKRAIQLGQFRPGERLSEQGLTESLGISRTPIRDALRKLEADRWVQRRRNGLVVASLSERDIRDLFSVRRLLDTFAAETCARVVEASQIAGLRAINAQLRTACRERDEAGIRRANVAFHRRLADLVDNLLFSHLVDQVAERMQLLTALVLTDPEFADRSADDHEGIIDAIEAGDGGLAEQRVREHLGWTEELYLVRASTPA